MHLPLLTLLFAALLWSQAPAGSTGRYYRLKLIRLMDEQGFGQPVEAARFLIPSDWRTEGGIRWDSQQIRCPLNIISTRFRATSPDGLSGIEITPYYSWQSASDPMMLQAMRQQAAMRTGCDVGPLASSVDYLRQGVIPRLRPGARLLKAELLPGVTQAKQAVLAQAYGPMLQAGYVRGFKADSGSVQITYLQNGQNIQEWLMTTILTVAMASANTAALMQGNMNAATYSVTSEGVFAYRAPAGRFDDKLIATILASVRLNPQYQAAVSNFLSNMNNIAVQGAMERSRIWREAGQQISATISESYQRQQAVQDRAAQQFSQAIRGVETYADPATGTRVELSGGYDNAWVNGRGEYLLSDSPGFNPAVALQENWRQLKKVR
jgi:hypothetical protein